MIAGRGGSISTTALAAVAALAWQVLGTNAECKFRFEGYLNISESPTWVVPGAEAFSSGLHYVLNERNPIVYLGEREREALPSVATMSVLTLSYCYSQHQTLLWGSILALFVHSLVGSFKSKIGAKHQIHCRISYHRQLYLRHDSCFEAKGASYWTRPKWTCHAIVNAWLCWNVVPRPQDGRRRPLRHSKKPVPLAPWG